MKGEKFRSKKSECRAKMQQKLRAVNSAFLILHSDFCIFISVRLTLGSANYLRLVRCDRDVSVLRARESQPLVHPGLRFLLRFGVWVRIPTRRMAVWLGRSGLGGGRRAEMVAIPKAYERQAKLSLLSK
jgi:hypothetical protein